MINDLESIVKHKRSTISYRMFHSSKISEIETMSRIILLILLYSFIFLNNVENSSLIKDKILSRLHKKSSVSNRTPPVTRQSHRCYSGCLLIASFNDPLILPDTCEGIETNYACEMIVFLDYNSQEIFLYDFKTSESLTIQNTTYDSATSHLISMTFNDSTILHIFTYICAIGDYCEWTEMQQMIPKLIALKYQPLYKQLLPIVFNFNGHPNMIQCYTDANIVNCTTGVCRYYQYANDDYQLETTRSCGLLESDVIEFEIIRHFPGPSQYDYSTLTFLCDQDRCNDASKEHEIRQIISSNGNEFLGSNSPSLRIHLSWTILNSFFFYAIIIRYF